MSITIPPSYALTKLTVSTVGNIPLFKQSLLSTVGQAWTTANLAFYMPIVVDSLIVVQKVAWVNGATAAGNFDVGIYNSALVKLASTGAVAQTGTSVLQVATLSVTLPPGNYHVGMSSSGTTGVITAVYKTGGATVTCGTAVETSAHPLPATATPVTNVGQPNYFFADVLPVTLFGRSFA